MARFLVTGARGFIGRRLAEFLENRGHQVDRFDSRGLEWPYHEVLLRTLGDFDGVFHVGANSNTLETDLNSCFRDNFEFTRLLAEQARILLVPLIYSSSAACYGDGKGYPSNLYAWSKLAGEDCVSSRGGVSLRYFNVYGPGECEKGPMASVFHQAYLSHATHRPFELFPGNPRRDFIHVDDVCEANFYAFENYPEFAGKTFDVGTAKSMTFEKALDLMSIPWAHTLSKVPPSGYQWFTQANQASLMPGWIPRPREERLIEYKTYLDEGCCVASRS